MSKRNPNETATIIINVFESINDTNVNTDVWVCDETLFRHIKCHFATIQSIDIKSRYFNLALSKRYKN